MTRKTVRILKRAVRDGLRADASDRNRSVVRDAALALLTRSINLGHGRLAVIRLGMAVDVGACIPQEHWEYCLLKAAASGDLKLQDIYRTAALSVSEGDRNV